MMCIASIDAFRVLGPSDRPPPWYPGIVLMGVLPPRHNPPCNMLHMLNAGQIHGPPTDHLMDPMDPMDPKRTQMNQMNRGSKGHPKTEHIIKQALPASWRQK